MRFIGGQVQNEQAVWFRLLRYAGMWSMLGFGYWVFEDKASGRYLGEGGLANACRGVALLEGVPEIGWALSPDAGGRGIASEAVGVVTDWADRQLRAPLTRCIIEPGNVASLRVAEKSGYALIETVDMGGTAISVLERRAPAA